MKNKTIKIRSTLTVSNLRGHLFRFFRNVKFASQYVSVFTKISANKGTVFYTLGNKVILDTESEIEKTSYINEVIAKFNALDSDSYSTKSSTNNVLMIYYLESDSEGYRKHLRNLSLSKTFDIDLEAGIQLVNNIPYTTNYKGWGLLFPQGNLPGAYMLKTLISMKILFLCM